MPGYFLDTIFKTENSNSDREQQSAYFQPTQAQLSERVSQIMTGHINKWHKFEGGFKKSFSI